jgi:hypothetical protein
MNTIVRSGNAIDSVLSGNRAESGALGVIALLLLAVAATSPALAQTGVYTLNGGTASETDQTDAATGTEQFAVYVLNSGHLTLTNRTLFRGP